eukprot:TRINITY_DN33239_c0_g1_i1.p1 TRINITY_DN33239_c0_g1~~TRINITY_DN33239_c0_g1_i1.p1  ORF type:complete len:268 (-),score=38.30 TRINITY_DN33239_c0_g1_i1:337-1140(-)
MTYRWKEPRNECCELANSSFFPCTFYYCPFSAPLPLASLIALLPPGFSYCPPPPHPHQFYCVTLILSFVASAVLLAIFFSIIAKYCCNRNTSRRSPAPTISSTHQDQTRRDDRSVGLDESVINSITVCKYKRGGGLFEGAECSICLHEFQEDENLRLLPNCVHGFHLPCIDRWLKSNVNCPLCRTNVMSNPLSSLWRDSCPSSSSGSGEEPQSHIRLEINERDGVGGNQSELGADEMANDDDIQLVRVSVTVDSTVASMIPKEVASN